jgi:hypothetical protein
MPVQGIGDSKRVFSFAQQMDIQCHKKSEGPTLQSDKAGGLDQGGTVPGDYFHLKNVQLLVLSPVKD